jgi:hypothetical protein
MSRITKFWDRSKYSNTVGGRMEPAHACLDTKWNCYVSRLVGMRGSVQYMENFEIER